MSNAASQDLSVSPMEFCTQIKCSWKTFISTYVCVQWYCYYPQSTIVFKQKSISSRTFIWLACVLPNSYGSSFGTLFELSFSFVCCHKHCVESLICLCARIKNVPHAARQTMPEKKCRFAVVKLRTQGTLEREIRCKKL